MKQKKDWKELPPEQVERALRGSREHLDALVQWYGPVVWAAVAARVRGVQGLRIEMEDLVQSVWLELLRNGCKRLSYYDRRRGELGYFIRMQASQIAWDLVMRELGRLEVPPGTASEPIDQRFEARMMDRDVLERLGRRVRERLTESDWALFNAVYFEGLSSDELAQRLGKKHATVYQQKYRLLDKLEGIVRELLEEERPGASSNELLVPLLVASLVTWMSIFTNPSP
jgi:RNA polymerase sigma factor (sigma-70 family)